MKRFFLTIMAAAAIMPLTGCDLLSELLEGMLDDGGEEEETVYVDKWANMVNETEYDATIDGSRMTYGSHSYSVAGDIDFDFDPAQYTQQVTATVTFSNIPSGFTEFKAVYEGLLGKSIQGAAAMVPMAMEIYARDAETGKKCTVTSPELLDGQGHAVTRSSGTTPKPYNIRFQAYERVNIPDWFVSEPT